MAPPSSALPAWQRPDFFSPNGFRGWGLVRDGAGADQWLPRALSTTLQLPPYSEVVAHRAAGCRSWAVPRAARRRCIVSQHWVTRQADVKPPWSIALDDVRPACRRCRFTASMGAFCPSPCGALRDASNRHLMGTIQRCRGEPGLPGTMAARAQAVRLPPLERTLPKTGR